ncbi:hypothetical protein AAF712_013779 [Marasmius tenuissimus]|uniref:Uncharacterized protein n=1 Tax=Marasmius tenuissimus TaxID=585030 RepID=A0ABR2ZCZ7_9AGAR|nr:hypothetical protein PM082_013798 [Marasmius tenuissimus]
MPGPTTQKQPLQGDLAQLELEERNVRAELKKAERSWKSTRKPDRKVEREQEVLRLQGVLNDTLARKEMCRPAVPSKRTHVEAAFGSSDSELSELPPGSEPIEIRTTVTDETVSSMEKATERPSKKPKSTSVQSSDRLAGRHLEEELAEGAENPAGHGANLKGKESGPTEANTPKDVVLESLSATPSDPIENNALSIPQPSVIIPMNIQPISIAVSTSQSDSNQQLYNWPDDHITLAPNSMTGDHETQAPVLVPATINPLMIANTPAAAGSSQGARAGSTTKSGEVETGDLEDEDGEGESDGSESDDESEMEFDPKAFDLERKAIEAVRKYLQSPRENRLKDSIRTHIRARASHCPEAGRSCFNLAKDVLVSRRGQLKCIYHYLVDKTSRVNDTKGDKDRLTGVPYGPVKATKVVTAEGVGKSGAFNRLTLPKTSEGEEYCHCGCRLEDAVWGLYLWKTGRISYNGQEHGYERQRKPPTPSERNFEITRLKGLDITLDRLWWYEPQVNHQGQVLHYRELSLYEHRQKLVLGMQQPMMPNFDGLLVMKEDSGNQS